MKRKTSIDYFSAKIKMGGLMAKVGFSKNTATDSITSRQVKHQFVGAPAFTIEDPTTKLIHMIGGGFFNEPKYYSTKEGKTIEGEENVRDSQGMTEQAREVIDTAKAVLQTENPEDLLVIANWVRTDLHYRSTPQVLLAIAASSEKTKASLRKYVPAVIQRADEIRQVFAAYNHLFNLGPTWNNTANAWNKARTNWMSLLYSMGLQNALNIVCPGKVMRLMAADVVQWHKMSGEELDPNTFVWNDLPFPWEVLEGKTDCNRSLIQDVCKKHKMDPEKSGWVAPKPKGKIEEYTPTPELVHGISVSSPVLAKMLKKAGWFSGKNAKSGIGMGLSVQYDEHGFVKSASE